MFAYVVAETQYVVEEMRDPEAQLHARSIGRSDRHHRSSRRVAYVQ